MATRTTSIQSATPVQLLTSANANQNAIANLDNANSVFIADSPNGDESAFELTAGSTISWDRYRALYAYVKGATVKVIVLDNGGQFFNGVAIANSLMTSGLAPAIATAIDAKQGIIQVGQQTAAAPAGILLGVLDSSSMQSILITGRITTAAPAVPIRLDVMFYSTLDQYGVVTATRTVYIQPNNTYFSLKVPAYGVGFYFTSDPNITAADVRIFKSKEPVQALELFQADPTYKISPLITSYVGGIEAGYMIVVTTQAAGELVIPLGAYTGNMQVSVHPVGTAGASVHIRTTAVTPGNILTLTAGTVTQIGAVKLPAYPIELVWYTAGATYSAPNVTLIVTP
jgi:hypothetical protein